MKRAIELAKKGLGFTSPNPCVGAVIVKKGKVIGQGYHKKTGGDHAEIIAIKDALKKKNSLKGVDMYVTFEPCCHYGRTGPCVSEIVRFGMKRVFVSHVDPSSKNNGKGIKFLKKSGIDVQVGLMEKEARILNQPFIKISKEGVPFVTLKAGISLDGRIATRSGKSEWITNELSRKHGHELRDNYDAIVVGANTVIIDNPNLASGKGRLLRVIIDGRLRVKPSARVFRDENVFVACSDLASKRRLKKFTDSGVRVKSFGKKKVNIKKLLKYLYKEFEVQSVFVEGGGETNGYFVDAGLVDDVYFYISPEIIGGKGAVSVVEGKGVAGLKKSLKLKNIEVKRLKDDILVHGVVNEY